MSDKVTYNEGFAEALEVVAYMCGWDFYHHTPEGDGTKETLRDKEAFAELSEGHEIESAPRLSLRQAGGIRVTKLREKGYLI